MVSWKKRDEIIIEKILREIDDIVKFTANMTEEEFYDDVKTQKAIVMSLINIGELSKSLSDCFTSSKDNVPWKKVQALRNVAAHKYETIDMQIIWDTIQISVTELREELTS